MTKTFRMDEAQPRLLDETGQGIIGAPLDRPEGPKKVSGRAAYAADGVPDNAAHGVLVRATISRGRITGIDTASVAEIPGLLGVFHGPRFIRNPAQGMAGEAPVQPGDEVHYHGQPIALVVAESFEAARDAAQRLVVSYDADANVDTDPAKTDALEKGDPETAGDFEAA
ncbi:MAG: xanthine dehydrogenase family protein molybdopterin-binding subunit, partial [Rhodobacteraceae bacterium]|nr:xanthine dehydrogenase family protein molybdopterin-binding subunit [Paracoccaceae bacterium]